MLLISSNSFITLRLHRKISILFCKQNGGLVKWIITQQTKHWVYTKPSQALFHTHYNIKPVMNLRQWLLSPKTRINSKATRPYRVTENLKRGRKQWIKQMFKHLLYENHNTTLVLLTDSPDGSLQQGSHNIVNLINKIVFRVAF